MTTAFTEELPPPAAYRAAQVLVWLAFAVHAFLTLFMVSVPKVAASFVIVLLLMGSTGVGLLLRAPWGRWVVTVGAIWLVYTWVYGLAVSTYRPGLAQIFDRTVDAVRFGGFGTAAVLLWLPSAREYYRRRRIAVV
jgi:hypothetical protein